MKVSFVIPTYNHFRLTSDLLMDIYQNCQSVDEVIVINNGGKEEETKTGFEFWSRVPFPLRVIELEENVGFLRASNLGLKEATGDIVVLISNDVRIYKDLAQIAKEIIKEPSRKILLGGRLYTDTTGWNCFDSQIFPYVEGWLLVATKTGWKELGYFDERYSPNDYEDVDISTTAAHFGYQLAQFPPYYGTVAEHIGAQTISYGDARLELTQQNRKKFEEKWVLATKASPS